MQTPRTLSVILAARERAARCDQDERLSLTWHAEALARQQRMPTLAKFLRRRPATPTRQSPDDMLASFRALHAGGAPMTIRKVG